MRPALALLALAWGVVAGGATLLLHQYWWGLGLGLVAAVLSLAALPSAWWGRLPFSLGWVGVAAYGAVSRPEGDFLVPANLLGYSYLLCGAALVVVVAITVPARARPGVDTGDQPAAT